MFLWRKSVEARWIEAHEASLQAHSNGRLVIVRRPGCKRLRLEIVCSSRSAARTLFKQFGGRVRELPRDWPERFTYLRKSEPLSIGKRLFIFNVEGTLMSRLSRHKSRPHIVIPAATAFGTGEHATTAMSLHLLEGLTRRWGRGWSLVDFGTGSGILALAAKRFGADRVMGIDNDPTAILQAKSNARLNRICGATFQLANVRECKPPQGTDVITANLYSDVLIEILPNLNRSRWLILSGVLRTQEDEFARALRGNQIEITSIKRRGKWIAILARCSDALRSPRSAAAEFLRRS